MNSTLTPTATRPDDALAARADERLAHAYEQIARADEQIARVTERLSMLDHGDRGHPSAVLGRRTSPGSAALRGLTGLLLAACIVIAAFVVQAPSGDKVKPIIARWAPQLVSTSSLQPERPGLPAQLRPSVVEVAAAADPAAPQAAPPAETAPQAARPQVTAPTAAPPTEQAQLLESMSRDLANLTQDIEQLKANQEQIASDNARAIEQLKAGQEQIAGDNARAIEQVKAGQEQLLGLIAKISERKATEQKVSQQNLRPKTSATKPAPPPRPIAAPARRPLPPLSSPQAGARPPARAPLEPDDQ
jgi:hypothetical protein